MTNSDQIARDEPRERHWLEHAEMQAGRSGFSRHAAHRLAAGDHAYGDRWARRELAELLAELSEEAADLGAWGVLALQALELQHLPNLVQRQIADRLHATIRLGAHAHRELVRSRLELRADIAAGPSGDGRP